MPNRSEDSAAAPVLRSTAEQARLEALLTDMFEKRISFNEVLGLRVQSFAPPTPSLRFDMKPELVGHYLYGRLHGGVISACWMPLPGWR
jgi:acyl-coenzyme A thioesterase PaaI-like protein